MRHFEKMVLGVFSTYCYSVHLIVGEGRIRVLQLEKNPECILCSSLTILINVELLQPFWVVYSLMIEPLVPELDPFYETFNELLDETGYIS
jgi:hypothetical protein